jgi:hypothetical protein
MPGSIYASAGDTISDGPGGILPANWSPPTGAVDPITSDAIQAYWNAGPKGQSDAEPNKWNSPWGWSRWQGITYKPPAVYWTRVPGGFQLTGAGASLGVHPI